MLITSNLFLSLFSHLLSNQIKQQQKQNSVGVHHHGQGHPRKHSTALMMNGVHHLPSGEDMSSTVHPMMIITTMMIGTPPRESLESQAAVEASLASLVAVESQERVVVVAHLGAVVESRASLVHHVSVLFVLLLPALLIIKKNKLLKVVSYSGHLKHGTLTIMISKKFGYHPHHPQASQVRVVAHHGAVVESRASLEEDMASQERAVDMASQARVGHRPPMTSGTLLHQVITPHTPRMHGLHLLPFVKRKPIILPIFLLTCQLIILP